MDLASKTASGITGTDYMMLVNNSEAYKALVNDVAEAILGKLTSKSFSGLETTAKNVIGALNELNSNNTLLFNSLSEIISFFTNAGGYIQNRIIRVSGELANQLSKGMFSVSGKGMASSDGGTIDYMLEIGSGSNIICGRIGIQDNAVQYAYNFTGESIN